MQTISKKVILVGNFGVGKTSLTRQFVFQKFADEYLTTLGVKIDKKTLVINDLEANLIIWDIAGEVSQTKVPKSYYLGANGIIYVFDLTRPSTFKNILEDLDYIKQMLPNVPYIIAGNKKDLLTEEQLYATIPQLPMPCEYLTSAKTGEKVELMFQELTNMMLKK
ncbi:MAG: GTP-binding protein [Thermoflexibacter sp.]|jgi:small GTP-binding protein|nr:GTP-binding protein [Thermoflexibacter sp.]